MCVDSEIKKYEKFWQHPDKYYIEHYEVDTITSDKKIRYRIWEPLPVIDQLWIADEELEPVVVAKMLEAGVKIFNQFPEQSIVDAMRAKRINEFVLVKDKHISKLSRYVGDYFAVMHKPTLSIYSIRDGNRQSRINKYKKLLKMGIEIWSKGKWEEYRQAFEQNDDT